MKRLRLDPGPPPSPLEGPTFQLLELAEVMLIVLESPRSLPFLCDGIRQGYERRPHPFTLEVCICLPTEDPCASANISKYS